jgi:hypothetical protein
MNYQVVCFGEILFDVLGDVSKPGGAPFNVAYHLKQSGIDSFLISSVGNDVYGEKLLGIVKDWGLDRRGIEISTSYQTGVAVVRHDWYVPWLGIISLGKKSIVQSYIRRGHLFLDHYLPEARTLIIH